jgi:hypothetical protein
MRVAPLRVCDDTGGDADLLPVNGMVTGARVPLVTAVPFARAWYEQTARAAGALARVHDDELRALSDEEALRRSEGLLSMVTVATGGRRTSGLVEQQALFARARRDA